MVLNMNEFLNSSQIAVGPYRWEAKTFKIIEVSQNKVRITGIAVHAGETSKNQNKYVREALIKATNTWIGKPLILNHKASEIVGNIELMDFDEETSDLKYTALVNKQPYVNMIRDKSTNVRGVSIGADYLAIKCSKCGSKFQSEEEWYDHATNKEFMRNLPREPHGIIGKDLSLVLAPEIPGCNTTLGVAETAPRLLGITELFDLVISESGNKKENMTVPTKIEETKVEAKPLAQTLTIREASTIPKIVYEEEACMPFEQCIKDGGSEEECARKVKETRIRNSNNKAVVETINRLVEAVNQPVVAPTPHDYAPEIKAVQEEVSGKLTELSAQLTSMANDFTAKVKAVSESVAAIKPYDDKALKEMIAAVPKDDLGWKEIKPYDDKPLRETIAAIKIPEAYNDAPLKEAISKIPIYNDAPIKEMFTKATKDFETLLAVADKNIAETRRSLESRITELTEANKSLKETVADQAKTIKETAILADNTADKLKPEYRGKAKSSTADVGYPNLVKPY
jgi:hypothetical protein